jgi:hypothetical protein
MGMSVQYIRSLFIHGLVGITYAAYGGYAVASYIVVKYGHCPLQLSSNKAGWKWCLESGKWFKAGD